MIGGDVVLAPPCPCGGNIHLAHDPARLARKRVLERRAIGCPEHGGHGLEVRWRPSAWESAARWPFRWPWGRR